MRTVSAGHAEGEYLVYMWGRRFRLLEFHKLGPQAFSSSDIELLSDCLGVRMQIGRVLLAHGTFACGLPNEP